MSKWPKWHWRSMSMSSIFNTSWEYPRIHLWCKNWWFQLKSVRSYRADKQKFTGGRTDGQTERHRQRQYPFCLKGQGVKCTFENVIWKNVDRTIDATWLHNTTPFLFYLDVNHSTELTTLFRRKRRLSCVWYWGKIQWTHTHCRV